MLHSHPILVGVLGRALEAASARYLALDPHSPELLRPLAGKVIALRFRPFGGILYLCPTGSSLQAHFELSGEADVILSGGLPAFARLGLGGEARASMASGAIEIEGDMETARQTRHRLGRRVGVLHGFRHCGSGGSSGAFRLDLGP